MDLSRHRGVPQKVTSLTPDFRRQVYEIVAQIPAGRVSTYGQIALWLGVPQCARLVGRVLRETPASLKLPCHRVVHASGRLVAGWEEQRALLRTEGIDLKPDDKGVDLRKHLWRGEE